MNSIKKNFFWNTIGSGAYAFNSLLFLIIATRINGEREAGIFTLCYATACLLYIVGTYSGRTYQVTEQRKDISDNEFIFNRVVTSIIAIVLGILFGIVNKYTGMKMQLLVILSVLKSLESLCDVFHGIFQKNERLDIAGKSMFIRSVLNILIFLFIDILTNSIILSSLSLIIIDIFVLALIDIKYSWKYKEKTNKINYRASISILKIGFYTFGFTLLSNYLVNIPRYAIDANLDESYQTIFGIIVMPGTFIILISQFVIQPLITKLKESWIKKDKKEFNTIVKKTSISILVIGIISIILAYFFGIAILNILYGINLSKYLISLIIILIGTTLYALSTCLSNCLIIFRKTKIQLVMYLLITIFGIIISKVLVNNYSFIGGVYSYLLIMMLLIITYIILFIFINNKTIDWKRSKENERENK